MTEGAKLMYYPTRNNGTKIFNATNKNTYHIMKRNVHKFYSKLITVVLNNLIWLQKFSSLI